MKTIHAISLAAAALASAQAFAQQRDAYGNIIAPDVARHIREQAREQAREEALRTAARERRIIPGMNENDVRSILGYPAQINDNGGHVQWVYNYALDSDGHKRPGSTYVYFRNGVTY